MQQHLFPVRLYKGLYLVRLVCFGALVCSLLLASCSSLDSAPVKSSPTRPGAATKARGVSKAAQASTFKAARVEWVSASSLASRMGLKLVWVEADKKFQLKGASGIFEFNVDSRECTVRGDRAFLGEAVRMVKGRPSFSRVDAEKFVEPVVRPGFRQKSIPSLKTIVLDPGHGGSDSGMVNKKLGLLEKVLTLDTAFRLKKLLEEEGFKVVLTRSKDQYIELLDRPDVAKKIDADLFVSIHFNSVEQGAERVTGVEVFTMTPQYQMSADQQPDPQFQNTSQPGNANDHWNIVIGYYMHRNLLKELDVPDRGLKRGRLAVLRGASCPAVLVESGYLSNETEAKKLATPQYRQRVAEALVDGIKDYATALEAARRVRR